MPEIRSPIRLYTTKQGKAGSKLSLPKVGKNYAVYFNLNAMRAGTYGLGGVSEKSALFKNTKKSMPVFRNKDGKSVSPHPSQRAKTYFGGSIYSFIDPKTKGRLVVSHQRTAELDDVVFEIHKNVVRDIQKTGSKTPCCFVEGTYVKSLDSEFQQNLITEWFGAEHSLVYREGWRRIVFNPKRNDTFMYHDEEKDKFFPAYTADKVFMMSLPTPASAVGKRSIPYLILALDVNGFKNTYTETEDKIQRKVNRRNPMRKRRTRRTDRPIDRVFTVYEWTQPTSRSLFERNYFISGYLKVDKETLKDIGMTDISDFSRVYGNNVFLSVGFDGDDDFGEFGDLYSNKYGDIPRFYLIRDDEKVRRIQDKYKPYQKKNKRNPMKKTDDRFQMGNNDHQTAKFIGKVDPKWAVKFRGQNNEHLLFQGGEGRGRYTEERWQSFLQNVADHGFIPEDSGSFIIVEFGKNGKRTRDMDNKIYREMEKRGYSEWDYPMDEAAQLVDPDKDIIVTIYEGNHRARVAYQLGIPLPLEMRFFGGSEQFLAQASPDSPLGMVYRMIKQTGAI